MDRRLHLVCGSVSEGAGPGEPEISAWWRCQRRRWGWAVAVGAGVLLVVLWQLFLGWELPSLEVHYESRTSESRGGWKVEWSRSWRFGIGLEAEGKQKWKTGRLEQPVAGRQGGDGSE